MDLLLGQEVFGLSKKFIEHGFGIIGADESPFNENFPTVNLFKPL